MAHAVWHGTLEELRRLREAAQNNCACEQSERMCGPHSLLVQQRLLDQLLFVSRAREWFIGREFTTEGGV